MAKLRNRGEKLINGQVSANGVINSPAKAQSGSGSGPSAADTRPKMAENGFSCQDPATGKIWKKVLYEQNPFPDNYTPDECFLAAIVMNKNLHKYTFWQCLQGSSQVSNVSDVFSYSALKALGKVLDYNSE